MRVFRFTICELALVTVVVALALGWWLDHRNAQRRFQAIQAWAGIYILDSYPIEMFEDLPPENLRLLRGQINIYTPADRKRWAAELEATERKRLAPSHSISN